MKVVLLAGGFGTRLSEYLVEWHKEYEGVFRLGQETDTQDATGEVIQEQSVEGLTGEAIQATAEKFTGVMQQVPPMYSALKVKGIPLYKMARAGKIKNFTGYDSPYEEPERYELRLDTVELSAEQAADKIIKYLKQNNYLENGSNDD